MSRDFIQPGNGGATRCLSGLGPVCGVCARLGIATLFFLVAFCAAALAAEGPAAAAQAASLPQTLCRYGTLVILFLLVGRLVSGWMRVPAYDFSAVSDGGIWAFGITLVLTFTASEALLLVPWVGPFIGGYGVDGAPGKLFPTIFGSLFWSAPLVIFTLFAYRIVASMFSAKSGGWAEMFVLMGGFAWGNWVLSGLRGRFGLVDPTKTSYAAFFSQVADRFVMPAGAFPLARFGFVVRPFVSAITFIDSAMHDLGLSVIAFGLLVGFAYLCVTYRARAKNRDYVSYYNDHLRYVYTEATELARQAALLRERMGIGCGYQLLVTLAKLLFLVVLYNVFTIYKPFQSIASVLPLSSLGGSVKGFAIPLVAGFSVLFQTTSGMWSTASNVRTALTGGLLGGIVVGVISYFAPAGVVLALTAITFADAMQTLYESKLHYLSIGKSLAPAVVIIPLVFLLMPRSIPPGNPSSSATSASSALVPKTNTPVVPGVGSAARDGHADAELGQIAVLRQEKKWQEALQAVDELTSKRPSSKGVLTEMKAGLLGEFAVDRMSHGDRAGAFDILSEALKIAPDNRAAANLLSEIWMQVGREEMKNVCIRRQPTDVASVLSTANIGQLLPSRVVADKPDNWLPVRVTGDNDGWVYAPLVDETAGGTTVKVKAIRGKHDVEEFLSRAVEVNPSARLPVLLLRLTTNWQVAVGLCIFAVLAGMVVVWISRN